MIIESAKSNDWSWIVEAQVETSFETLPALRRATMDKSVLRKHISKEMTRIAKDDGKTCTVLVARKTGKSPIGFVWVGDRHGLFTNEVKAFVYGVYVTQEFRRHGIGKILMEAAENWAMSRGHLSIGLNVAAHNIPALSMYESLGFHVDATIMSKNLSGKGLVIECKDSAADS